MPADYRTVEGHDVKTFIYNCVLQVGRMKKLLNSIQGDFVRCFDILRSLLRNFKLEYLSLFVCLDWVIAAMKLIFCDIGSILRSQARWVSLLCLLWVTWPYHFFPFCDWILGLVAEKKNTALATGQISYQFIKVLLFLVFVHEIHGFLLEEFPLY